MFRNIFSHIQGIEIYPILTLLFFFAFFTSMLFMVIKLDRKFVSYMGSLPLENDETQLKIKGGE
jgi:cytochrome c oxidase cbb3-type subunit IV